MGASLPFCSKPLQRASNVLLQTRSKNVLLRKKLIALMPFCCKTALTRLTAFRSEKQLTALMPFRCKTALTRLGRFRCEKQLTQLVI